MQRQVTISKASERTCIYNPKPNGKRSKISHIGLQNQLVHYDRHTNIGNALLRYADTGLWVPHDIPIWVFPLGICREKGYYTVENGKPREVFRTKTYISRYYRHLRKTGVASDNVSSLIVGEIYNKGLKSKQALLYTSGPNANTQVPPDIKIYKVLTSSYPQKVNAHGKYYRYYVITEDGHINPVAIRKTFLQRDHAVKRLKEEEYKKKVSQLRIENQERKKDLKNEKKRKKLDDMPSIRKQDQENLIFLSNSNFTDSEESSIHTTEDKNITLLDDNEITKQVMVPISLPTQASDTSENIDNKKEEIAIMQLGQPEKPYSLMCVSTPVTNSSTLRSKNAMTKSNIVEINFFDQRQQTLSLQKAKEKMMAKEQEIKREQMHTIIRSSAYIGTKEKLKNLNEINCSKENRKVEKDIPITNPSLLFPNQVKSKINLEDSSANNSKNEIRKRMRTLKRKI